MDDKIYRLFRELAFIVLFLTGVTYIVLIRDVAPNEPDFLPIFLVGGLSFANVFYWLVLTVSLVRRIEWRLNRRTRDIVIELTKLWQQGIGFLLFTLLFYTFLFRMGGVQISDAAGTAVYYDAATCVYYATINWITAGFAIVISNPQGSAMHLIVQMEALTGGLSMAGLIAAVIVQVRLILRPVQQGSRSQ